MDLKEKIKNLPACPGVYLMKDSLDSVIYVGKSKNLKNRVGSYFQNTKSHSPKVVKMVKNLKDFDYIVTDTEFEAFLLECKLIQEIKPIYNRLMKSPQSYAYVKITVNEKMPDFEITREFCKNDGNLYFGPYTSRNTVERGLQGIRECYKILCTGSKPRKSASCLNHSLGLCIGMCLESTPREQYTAMIDKVVRLFNCKDKSILEDMEQIMNTASERLDFEAAAKYRDYLSAVNYLINKAKVVEYTEKNKNIALLEPLSDNTFKFFLIKGNKVLFSEKYELDRFDSEKTIPALKTHVLSYFNKKTPRNSLEIGREEIDEAQIIYSYLKSNANNCKYVVLAQKWLNAPDSTNIDAALKKLWNFLYGTKSHVPPSNKQN